MRKIAAVVAMVAVAGCVSAQPGAERIVLTGNAANVSGCRFVTQESVSAVQMLDPATNQRDIQTAIRNKAAELGATHVLTSGPTAQNPSVLIQTGDFYRC